MLSVTPHTGGGELNLKIGFITLLLDLGRFEIVALAFQE